MSIKYKIFVFFKKLGYFFRPINTLLMSLALVLIIDSLLVFVMLKISNSTTFYNVLFALVTGFTASFGVSILLEMFSNYKNNNRRVVELSELYNALYSFEVSRYSAMWISKKRINDKERETFDELKHLWKHLPKIIAPFQKVYQDKREYLSDKELRILKNILDFRLKMLKTELRAPLYSSLVYGMVNKPDMGFIKDKFPKSIYKELSNEFKKALSEVEFNKALDYIIDESFRNTNLFSVSFDNIKVGEEFVTDEDVNPEELTNEKVISDSLHYLLNDIFELEKECRKVAFFGYSLDLAKKLENNNELF